VSVTTSDPTGNPLQSDTVTGSLMTDGTIGALHGANIVGWDLDLVDNLNAAYDYDLTPANSSLIEDGGGALSATASGLDFDFSGSGEFLIQANSPGPFSGYRYFCFSTGIFACLAGETISPGYIFTDGVVLTGAGAPVGMQPVGPPPSGAPEPATWAMMLLGFGGLGAAVRASRRRAMPA